MSKELKALKDIKECLYWSEEGIKKIETIETALKDYEQLKIVAKPLTDEEKKSINSVARRLKALEIIKEKKVDIEYFYCSIDVQSYNYLMQPRRKLTQEEFDLLKEVLK